MRKELDAARRAGFRQAAPFSKGAPVPHPRRPGRKPGRAYGRQGRRAVPPVVDERYEVPLPRTCPRCGDRVDDTHVTVQYQEDLPPVRPHVRRFEIHVGRCRGCGQRVQGRHPLQTSDAVGAAAVQIGPDAVATAAVLNKQLGLSFGKIATFFAERCGLQVARSAIVRALHRAGAKALPTYAALVQTVRGSPMVVADETGWRVHATLWWLWVFTTPDTTVYAILPGRGFEEAASLLGARFAGTLVHDGWAPYRRFTEAAHQSCLGHLLERCRELRTDYPRAPLPGHLQAVLQATLSVRDRQTAGAISEQGVAIARGRLANRLSGLLEQRTTVPEIARFMRHVDREWDALFSFLFDSTIDATNWRAEQAIRGAVITRKVCGGGNRTTRGAVTQEVLASVLRTTRQRGLDTHAVLTPLLRARTPVASSALQMH
ncbi:MAG TPA: IS66 family transposase [bacterium]|nr:IS66 family transposase [bacterium]